MNKTNLARLTVPLVVLTLVGACRGNPPDSPDISTVQWASYTNQSAGYSLRYPDPYVLDEHDNGVLFRHDGYPCIAISHVSEAEGRNHGLWFGHNPVSDIELNGRPGKKYLYIHYDGPFYMRTVSYVVEHQGKYLGLEFRTELEHADAIQQQILDSFVFTK